MSLPLVDEAAERARDLLRECVTPLGLRASASPRYREVWTRDAMIVLLGACAFRLEELVLPLRTTLDTLTALSSELGSIPLNVAPDGRRGTANAAAVDSNLWYVIGHRILHDTFGAADLVHRHRDALRRAMLWVRYQDTDGDGLLETQEAADWADLLASRGKVLYSNVLYVLALESYAALAAVTDASDAAEHQELAALAARRINELHWVESQDGLWDSGDSPALHAAHTESRRLAQATHVQLWSRPYYLPWVGFRDFGDWCDVLGNCLAVLSGVADAPRRERILTFFDQVGITRPYPARSLYPPIAPGHKDWRDYYRNGNLNLPDQYHNGGIWPFIGGFVVAAYVHAGHTAEAAELLARLAEVVRAGHVSSWEFNEWHHGTTGRPMGAPRQAWSAAMYLYAYEAVRRGSAPHFIAPGFEHIELAVGGGE